MEIQERGSLCFDEVDGSVNGSVDGSEEEAVPMIHKMGSARVAPMDAGVTNTQSDGKPPGHTNLTTTGGIIAQSLVTGVVLILAAGAGAPIGLSAVLLPQLQHPNSSIPTTPEMGSWIASVHSAASPVGTLLSGPLMDRFGRNMSLQLTVPILLVGWLLLATAVNHIGVLGGRVVCGVATGLMAAPSQVYLGEVAEPKLRGVIIGSPFVAYSLGILLVFALGAALPWRIVIGLACFPPAISWIAFRFLPESPVWLVNKGRLDEAQRSLDWLRGGAASGQSSAEFQQLVLRTEAEKKEQELLSGKEGEVASFWTRFSQPQVLKPVIFMNAYNISQILSGTFTVIFYAVDLIDDLVPGSDTGINSYQAAVLTAGARLGAAMLATVLLLVMGRRHLAITSALCTAFTSLLLGTFTTLRKAENAGLEWLIPRSAGADTWICNALVILYVAANSSGMFVLPGIMMGELLPSRMRGIVGSWIFCVFNLSLFFFTKIYPSMSKALGSEGMFLFFGSAATLNALLVFFFLPETKGRSLGEIEDYFKGGNLLWMRRPREIVDERARNV